MKPLKILIIRNDKLGDFALALPTFQALKRSAPHVEIVALVPNYTAPIAELCPDIDRTLIDPGPKASLKEQFQLYKQLKTNAFDAVLCLFSTGRIATLLALAGVPNRIAPATKWAQLLFHHRIKQKRSQSILPEYQYNLNLIQPLFKTLNIALPIHKPTAPYLPIDPDQAARLKTGFCKQHVIPEHHHLIFIHPGSGGSASNLALHQYAELASLLGRHKQQGLRNNSIVITAGPGEEATAATLRHQLDNEISACVLHSTEGLQQFVGYLQICDLFISGSTGTLHLAAALNKANVGFYPNLTTASALRWQTVSDANKRLSFSPAVPGNDPNAMATLEMPKIAKTIIDAFLTAD